MHKRTVEERIAFCQKSDGLAGSKALGERSRRLGIEAADLAFISWICDRDLRRDGVVKRQLLAAQRDQRGGDLAGVALVPGFGEIGNRVDRADKSRGSQCHQARVAGADANAV